MSRGFLPVTRTEMKERGWDEVDFVYVSGDAYVDHPSFGHAIITRLLEAHGYRVGIIAQPDWKDKESVCVFGEPRLGFLVSGGNMDSMVNHYTVSKKRRRQDSYTPGGEMGRRPDYAVVVYGNLIRQTYKNTPIILGGIEASLRRLAHYDYWSDKLKRSVLLDSGSDEDLLYPRKPPQFPKKFQIVLMICLQILTGLWKQALLVHTGPVLQLLITGRRTEVGRRASHIMNISLELFVFCKSLCLIQQGGVASRLNNPSLMKGERAKAAGSKTSSVADQAELDLRDGRHTPGLLVRRMISAHIGKPVDKIHLFLCKRLCGWILYHI